MHKYIRNIHNRLNVHQDHYVEQYLDHEMTKHFPIKNERIFSIVFFSKKLTVINQPRQIKPRTS